MLTKIKVNKCTDYKDLKTVSNCDNIKFISESWYFKMVEKS